MHQDIKQTWMKEAIQLSLQNVESGEGGPFGAIIVSEGQIVARGNNRVIISNDPSAHAEIVAIRAACQVLGTFQLDGCEIYTSCEPCPMCLGAIYWARISKIYYANTRDEAASIGFDDAYIYEEISKPLSRRSLPIEHLPHTEAFSAFQHWYDKQDRVKY